MVIASSSLVVLSGRFRRPVLVGVELDDEVRGLLAADAPVAVGVSGGKDSCAAAIAVVEHLRAIGHRGSVVLVHADLGDPDPALDVEWRDSLPTCERLAAFLGVELIITRRAAGGMVRRWKKRWENNLKRYADLSKVILLRPWSTPSMRFCTSELKSAPIAAELVRRFPGRRIVSACGVRREEGNGPQQPPPGGFARICAPAQCFALNFRAGDLNNRAAEARSLAAIRCSPLAERHARDLAARSVSNRKRRSKTTTTRAAVVDLQDHRPIRSPSLDLDPRVEGLPSGRVERGRRIKQSWNELIVYNDSALHQNNPSPQNED